MIPTNQMEFTYQVGSDIKNSQIERILRKEMEKAASSTTPLISSWEGQDYPEGKKNIVTLFLLKPIAFPTVNKIFNALEKEGIKIEKYYWNTYGLPQDRRGSMKIELSDS